MKNDRDMNLNQRLSLLQKACLIDRIVYAYVAIFFLVLLCCILGMISIKEHQAKCDLQEVYESTIELNQIRKVTDTTRSSDTIILMVEKIIE